MTDATDNEVMTVGIDDDGRPMEEVSLDAVRSGLDSDDNSVRSRAATLAAGVALDDADRGAALAAALCEAVRDDHRVVVYKSVVALSQVAAADPSLVEPCVDRLVELLDHDVVAVRTHSARILDAVADEHPGRLTDHVGALVAGLSGELESVVPDDAYADVESKSQAATLQRIDRDHKVEQTSTERATATALVTVVEHDPAAAVAHVSELAELLDATDVVVLSAAADALASVAEHDSDAVAEARDALVDVLDHPNDGVAATAVVALGHAGDPTVAEDVRAVADDADRDDDVRDLAAETAGFLDDR